MALTGHLSDLSLSELIEFFCNQRKSGRLKVLYPKGPGYFYLQAGSVVDARIGVLHGIDAVYYALTLPNAEFEFNADAAAENRTINQPWTQVVLEGLRRLDENISPGVAFPPDYVPEPDELQSAPSTTMSEAKSETERSFPPAFLAFGKESGRSRKPFFIGAAAVAVVASVAVIGVPAGWYKSKPAATTTVEATNNTQPSQTAQSETPAAQPQPAEAASTASPSEDPAAEALRRQREKERRAREAAKAAETATTTTPAPTPEAAKPGAKRVVVTVTYDESGRVTQASGGDANALRIARQKRFPPGKAGSATITIPIND
ncbi:MAG TPA: DUF4388 domain-containing protein [Pyrinomonadaceae bacterium]|nr:DUF4388 domain-containing protein [Pyrinomonadaceae bacterium]